MRCDCCGAPIFDREPSIFIDVPVLCHLCNMDYIWVTPKISYVGKQVPDFAETHKDEYPSKTGQILPTVRNRPAELENNSWDGYPTAEPKP